MPGFLFFSKSGRCKEKLGIHSYFKERHYCSKTSRLQERTEIWRESVGISPNADKLNLMSNSLFRRNRQEVRNNVRLESGRRINVSLRTHRELWEQTNYLLRISKRKTLNRQKFSQCHRRKWIYWNMLECDQRGCLRKDYEV